MSRDDYLLDPRAPVDPEIAALEKALAPLKFEPGTPSERILSAQPQRPKKVWPLLLATTAAAAAIWLWLNWPTAELYPGCPSRSYVAADTELEVRLGDLAVITLRPDSELEFVHWREGEQALFRLKRGGMTADVVPPPRVKPRFFVVETDRTKVVDLGCRFNLLTSPDGTQSVYVENGAVTFADEFREVIVPAGARAELRPNPLAATQPGSKLPGRLGTPTYLTASPELKRLVERYDDLRNSKDPSRLRDLADKLNSVCQDRQDTLPLWHMLQDGDLLVAKIVTDCMFRLVGAPDGKSPNRLYPAADWLDFLRAEVW